MSETQATGKLKGSSVCQTSYHVNEDLSDDEGGVLVGKDHEGATRAFKLGRLHLAGHQPWQWAYSSGEDC